MGQIVVLQEGRINEHGGHIELILANGPCARPFKLQARGYNRLRSADTR